MLERATEVWYYFIEGGGHTWPSGLPQQIPRGIEQFFGNINRDINASVEIWNFFNRHVLIKVVSTQAVQPSAFQVQVYSNPFSSNLKFEFELPRNARVQMSLFNTLGQPVARIADRELPRGKHRLQWQAGGIICPTACITITCALATGW